MITESGELVRFKSAHQIPRSGTGGVSCGGAVMCDGAVSYSSNSSDDDAAGPHEAAGCLAREELLEQVCAGVFGQLCTVTHPGLLYSTVNFKEEKGRWDTAELREAQPYAGEIYPDRADRDNSYGWNGWMASRGDQGTVVHAWTDRGEEAHTTAWDSGADVLLLHMSSSGDDGRPRFLPIGVRGVQAQHQLPLAVPAAEAHEEQQGGGGGGACAAGVSVAARDCAAIAGVTAVVASTATGGAGGGGGSRGSGSSSSSSSSDDDAA